VGRVVKPHGLVGGDIVDLWTNRPERLAPGTELATESGTLVVVSSQPYQDRYLVFFEGVGDRAGSEAIRGTVLKAPPMDAEDELWVHELVGARVLSIDGRHLGQVVAVEANPASDLLVLDGGGLVPLRFVTEHRPNLEVVVDIPDGLLD